MDGFDIDYPKAVLAGLSVGVVIALIVAGATSTVAFGAFNPSWDGASTLRERADSADLDAQIIRDTAEFENVPANDSLGVILSPDQSYSPTEAARLTEFVQNGGTLLVAEDFGSNTNQLLRALGVQTRIEGTPLRDERHYYRSPAFPIANNVSNHSLMANVPELTLNHGTVVQPNGATVLANSSSYAYLDTNGNGGLDDTETMDQYPVATIESVGQGRVVVVSDPSVFINAMLDRPGNAAFVDALLSTTDRVLIDASHTADIPPLIHVLLTVRGSPLLQLIIGLAGLTPIIIFGRRPETIDRIQNRLRSSRSTGRVQLSADEVASVVAARHPEWDDERIQRISRHFEYAEKTTQETE